MKITSIIVKGGVPHITFECTLPATRGGARAGRKRSAAAEFAKKPVSARYCIRSSL